MTTSTEATIVALEDREHLLLRPDTLIGSTVVTEHVMPVYTVGADGALSMEWKRLSFAPAIQNLYQEILTNALDRQYRDDTLRHISVWVDCDAAGGAGHIRVRNDGMGVPVQWDEDHQVWKPTMAFSYFRAGSNFADDAGPRFTAGRNGYGCKATNVFSKVFIVHTADPVAKKQFQQTFGDNMTRVGVPRVTSFANKKGFTDVTFQLDFARLGEPPSTGMRTDLVDLVRTLTINAIACLQRKVCLTFNGVTVGAANTHHVKLLAEVFAATKEHVAHDTVKVDDIGVLEVCATRPATKGPTDVLAFVNSLECSEGTHVNYVWNRLVQALEQLVKNKFKKAADFSLSPATVKKHLFLVIKVLVSAPHFSSQTKERLSTPASKFGFEWSPSPSFLRMLTESGIIESIHEDVVDKEFLAARKTMSQKVTTTTGSRRMVVADKYDAATALRTNKKVDCYLLVTEGDSARALAVAGLAVVGRERYGIYALKGKPLNVRNASTSAIAANKEVSTLMQILGLTLGKPVTSLAELTYRKLVIFSDQDPDGAHIGGLLLNFIHALFPSILALDPAYVQRFPTPLVRATHKRSGQVHCFYAKVAFDTWASTQPLSQYDVRYFKGLGTSTSALAREYFSQYTEHVVDIVHTPPADPVMVNMFGTEHSAARRTLLSTHYNKDLCVDYALPTVTMEEFVYREVLPYSNYSNVRNIASSIDGLKPVQRKVLFTMLDKNVVNDVKVAQIVGVIAAHTQYHHGEQSLMETVVGMAQDHVGVSNINLLVPEGQFGSRLDPPSVHSAARYIFTRLEPIARFLFRAEDDAVLTYVQEEGETVEPEYYVPIIPMVLVNGTFGIGTGWSTSVPCFDPEALLGMCETLARHMLAGGNVEALVAELCAPSRLMPRYDGFKGEMRYDARDDTYTTVGCVELVEESRGLRVTELPVGVWTHPFVEDVEKKMLVQRAKSPSTKKRVTLTDDLVVAVDKQWTDAVVDMTLYCAADKWATITSTPPVELCKALGLTSDLRLNNMHLHNSRGALVKYDTVASIVLHFVSVRVELYGKRKTHMLASMRAQARLLEQKRLFIQYLLADSMPISGKSAEVVEQLLVARGFTPVEGTFDFLLNMPFKSLTAERAAKLEQEYEKVVTDLTALEGKDALQLWLDDLADLRVALGGFKERKAKRYAPFKQPGTSKKRGAAQTSEGGKRRK